MIAPWRPAASRHSFAGPTRNLARLLACITILSIAGTLSGCGRYGSPVRATQVGAGESPESLETNRPVSDVGITNEDRVDVTPENTSFTRLNEGQQDTPQTSLRAGAGTTVPDEFPDKPTSKPRAPEDGASENGTE